MRLILAILFTALYLTFNIGLTLRVHQCNDMSEAIKTKEIAHQKLSKKACHEEVSHACCKESEKSSCCSIEMNEDDCCIDEAILFQINQEQLVSKIFLLSPIVDPVFSQNVEYKLTLNSVSHERYIVKNPPPLIEQKPILYCSLTFYG